MDKIYLLQAETGFEGYLVIINAYRNKKEADDACIKLKHEMDLLKNKYSLEEIEKFDDEYDVLPPGEVSLEIRDFINWKYFTNKYENIRVEEYTLL